MEKKEPTIDELLLKKSQLKYFGKLYQNMDKHEREEAYRKLLKRVVDLETLIDLEEAIKNRDKGALKDDSKN